MTYFETQIRFVVLGTGSFVAAIQTASERIPFIVGKPETYLREFLIDSHQINPKRTLMIGDRYSLDIVIIFTVFINYMSNTSNSIIN